MGRYLSAGIPAKISIYGKENWNASKLARIKKEIEKYTDFNLYKEKVYEDGAIYELKKDIFTKNIYNTLKEFECFTQFVPFRLLNHIGMKEEEVDYFKLNQKDFPCKLIYNHKDESGHVESGVKVKDDFWELDHMYPPEFWLVADSNLISWNGYDCTVYIEYVTLWQDYDKYCGEDESNMLRFLNRLKIPAFRDGNPLTKTIMFFVLG